MSKELILRIEDDAGIIIKIDNDIVDIHCFEAGGVECYNETITLNRFKRELGL